MYSISREKGLTVPETEVSILQFFTSSASNKVKATLYTLSYRISNILLAGLARPCLQ